MGTEKETKDSNEACQLGFDIGGMHCAACSSRIERVVGQLDGVDKVSVNLATPMSIMVGTGRGAQLGVLIKNGAALEQAGRITTLAVDKTGTLTTGKPVLTGISVLAADGSATDGVVDGLAEKDLLTLAAALEARSEHPLALALILSLIHI